MVFWIWGSLFVLTVIAEVASQQLISIWFAAGSLVALLAALCGVPIWLQALLFVAASTLLLILTRPLVRKYQFAVGLGKIRNSCANRRCGKRNGQSTGR